MFPRASMTLAVILFAAAARGNEPELRTLTQLHRFEGPVPGSQFGGALDLQGRLTIVGAINRGGRAYLYDVQSGEQLHEYLANEETDTPYGGISVAIDDDQALIGRYSDDVFLRLPGSAFLVNTHTGEDEFHLRASDAVTSNNFGYSGDMESPFAVIGAPTARTGGVSFGAAYVFDTATGSELAKLAPDDAHEHQLFGLSVDVEGGLAVVGAPQDDTLGEWAGAADLFDMASGTQLFKLTADDAESNNRFGESVAIRDGLAIVGAPDLEAGSKSGAAYVFDVHTGEQLYKLTGDETARKVGGDVDIFGNLALVGASGSPKGAAFLFDLRTGDQIAKLLAADASPASGFGQTVALNGRFAVIGAPADNSVYVFVVPEPSTAVLLLAGACVAVASTARWRVIG